MRFDGPTFARAWLAVTLAAHTDPDVHHLYRAVLLEQHQHGVVLVSTDQRVLLKTWVPYLEHMGKPEEGPVGDAPEPPLDVLPDRAWVFRDLDHRGQGFLRYAIKLSAAFPKEIRNHPGLVKIDLAADVDSPDSTTQDTALAGMESRFLAMSIPDAEVVYIPELRPAVPVGWRDVLASLPMRRVRTDRIEFSPDILGIVAGVARYAPGPITWGLSGASGPIGLTYGAQRPPVSGIAMPRRVDDDTDHGHSTADEVADAVDLFTATDDA